MVSSTPTSPTSPTTSRRRGTSVSSVTQSVVSVTERVFSSDVPGGFVAATAQATSCVPTIGEIRRGSIKQQDAARGTVGRDRSSSRRVARTSRGSKEAGDVDHTARDRALAPFPPLEEERTRASSHEQARADVQVTVKRDEQERVGSGSTPSNAPGDGDLIRVPESSRRACTSGYAPPPKVPWTTATINGLRAFWTWFCTPFGFLLTLYGLNVVAWGGMLFLLLCGAAPGMCWVQRGGTWFRDCNDIDSPRRIWIEIDSQILNALFCVTGFGLAPWRFRDLYYLLRYRFTSERKHGLEKKMFWLRKLAGHYRIWFRLPGSQTLDQLSAEEYLRSISAEPTGDVEAAHDVRLPLPLTKAPDPPISGVRAPPTATWKADWFIWCQVWNTFFQCCLCGFMWGMSRYDRPSWSTGLFVALACIIAGAGGYVSFKEGRLVKKVEGMVPPVAAQECAGVNQAEQDVKLALHQTRTGEDRVRHLDEKSTREAAAWEQAKV